MSLGIEQCTECNYQTENRCPFTAQEKEAIFIRNYCRRAMHNGQTGEMTRVGFKPWDQIRREIDFRIKYKGPVVPDDSFHRDPVAVMLAKAR